MKNELILEVGAAGGSLKISGTRTSQGWLFRTCIVDQSAMFLSDEDRGDLPLDSKHNSGWVNSWEPHWHTSTNTHGTACIRWLFIVNSKSGYGRLCK